VSLKNGCNIKIDLSDKRRPTTPATLGSEYSRPEGEIWGCPGALAEGGQGAQHTLKSRAAMANWPGPSRSSSNNNRLAKRDQQPSQRTYCSQVSAWRWGGGRVFGGQTNYSSQIFSSSMLFCILHSATPNAPPLLLFKLMLLLLLHALNMFFVLSLLMALSFCLACSFFTFLQFLMLSRMWFTFWMS